MQATEDSQELGIGVERPGLCAIVGLCAIIACVRLCERGCSVYPTV
jgi:hypothetical protein